MASSSTTRSSSQRSTPIRLRRDSNLPSFDQLYAEGTKLSFQLIFVDLQKVVCDALTTIFPRAALRSEEVNIIQGKLESYLEHNNIDCIVFSSNAFGLMDHGFDRSVCNILQDKNHEIKTKIQQAIIDKYYGEQPIGTCMIMETQKAKIKYIAHAPTRRVNYSIKGTDNVYMTMKAICNEIRIFNQRNSDDINKQIKTVLLTGLGTFYGAVSPQESARQTALSWLLARLPMPTIQDINWKYAKLKQSLIGYGGFTHFINYIYQYPEHALSKTQQKIIAESLPKSVIAEICTDNQDMDHNQDMDENQDNIDTKKRTECHIM